MNIAPALDGTNTGLISQWSNCSTSSSKPSNPVLKLVSMWQPVEVQGRLRSLRRRPMHSEITRKGRGKDRRIMRLEGPNQVSLFSDL